MARLTELLGLLVAVYVCTCRVAEGRLFHTCGTPACLCFPARAFTTCARLPGTPRLRNVPTFNRRHVAKVTGLQLSNQAITRVRPADLARATFPALKWVDLRANAVLNCSSLRVVPAGVKILSDCPKTTPPPPPMDEPEPGMTTRKDNKQHSSPSSLSASSSSSAALKSVDVTMIVNKTKGKQLLIPFKGYFKLFLPDL